MTEPEATGSRRERCALAAAFLLSETTQDAAVAASALVALQLFGGYEESLFIVIVMTMLLIGIQLSHVVGRRGWTLVLGGAAVCGALLMLARWHGGSAALRSGTSYQFTSLREL